MNDRSSNAALAVSFALCVLAALVVVPDAARADAIDPASASCAGMREGDACVIPGVVPAAGVCFAVAGHFSGWSLRCLDATTGPAIVAAALTAQRSSRVARGLPADEPGPVVSLPRPATGGCGAATWMQGGTALMILAAAVCLLGLTTRWRRRWPGLSARAS